MIERLGPNEKVVACEWWKDKPRKKDTTTAKRTEKMEYAIRGGLSDEFVTQVLKLNLSVIIDRTHQAVDELNKYVHYTEDTFNIAPSIGNKLVENTLLAVQRFFEVIDDLKNMVSEALETSLHDSVMYASIDDVLKEVDVLATHYIVEGSGVNLITIDSIDDQSIKVKVDGYVDVEHQYGSDRDFDKGDGTRIGASYPFIINLELDVHDPLNFNIETDDLIIDTDDFYGDENEDYEQKHERSKETPQTEDKPSPFDPTQYF